MFRFERVPVEKKVSQELYEKSSHVKCGKCDNESKRLSGIELY